MHPVPWPHGCILIILRIFASAVSNPEIHVQFSLVQSDDFPWQARSRKGGVKARQSYLSITEAPVSLNQQAVVFNIGAFITRIEFGGYIIL